METANQLLRDWRDINKARGGKAPSQARGSPYASRTTLPPPPESQVEYVAGDIERLKLSEPVLPPKTPDQAYGRQTQTPTQETFGQQPAQGPYPPRVATGGRVPPFPTEPAQAQPGRPISGSYDTQDGYGYSVRASGTSSVIFH